jgi:hypothetical protein
MSDDGRQTAASVLQEETEAIEKTFPRMARINADQTKLPGSTSATISEIRGESDREFLTADER